jgi:hypothetical protein
MKRFWSYLLVCLLVLGFAMAVTAAVKNTPHDIAYWKNNAVPDTRQVCVNCHSPHATGTSSPELIWNRNRVATAPTNFYSSATFDMGPANNTLLAPRTTLCLTCHDGQASTLVNYPGSGNTSNNIYHLGNELANRPSNIMNSAELTDDHPVAFVYDPSADQQGNNFPSITNGKINNKYPVYTVGTTENTFQCATCHDVHNADDVANDGILFTRGNMQSSQMCSECHTNK